MGKYLISNMHAFATPYSCVRCKWLSPQKDETDISRIRCSTSWTRHDATGIKPARFHGHYIEKRTIVASSSNAASQTPKRLAVLVSGGGRSLENLCERVQSGGLTGCEIKIVIASKTSAGAIEKAERYGIPTRVLRYKDYNKDTQLFSDAISATLDEYRVDLVVLAGWMHFYFIPPHYGGRVINIHPSLIPAFCGKGYYGHHVHEAVIEFGAKVSGCTVHLADNKYDHGPIIVQKAVQVHDDDTPDDLAARVFEKEKEALPEAIQLFVDERLSIEGRNVRVVPTDVARAV